MALINDLQTKLADFGRGAYDTGVLRPPPQPNCERLTLY